MTDGRHPSQLKRMAVALVVAGLRAELELTLAELGRYADRTAHSYADVLICACDLGQEDCRMLRRLSRQMPYMRHVIVFATSNPMTIRRALNMGAKGLVDERQLEQALAAAVRAVAAGLLALSPEAGATAAKPIFTHREKEILALVVDGLTNNEIAARLGLSESTIKSHLASAFAKLGVHSRSEAAAMILDPECGLASTALPARRRHSPAMGVGRAW